MKHFSLLLLISLFLLMHCQQQQRYAQNSPEIDAFLKLNKAYETMDYSYFDEIYDDSAKIYYNSIYPFTYKEATAGMIISMEQFSEISYSKNSDIEMVITDEGEKWVNYWGVFTGTLIENGKLVQIPLHLTARFVDGKIVEESGYWDNQILFDALAED